MFWGLGILLIVIVASEVALQSGFTAWSKFRQILLGLLGVFFLIMTFFAEGSGYPYFFFAILATIWLKRENVAYADSAD